MLCLTILCLFDNISYVKKFNLRKKDKIILFASLILYISWIIVTIVLYYAYSDVASTKHLTWALSIGTVLTIMFKFFIFFPDIKPLSKNMNNRTKSRFIELRRDFCSQAMISSIIGFFIMSVILIFGLDNIDINPKFKKIGIVEIATMLTFIAWSIESCIYFSRTKELIKVDYLQHLNEQYEEKNT